MRQGEIFRHYKSLVESGELTAEDVPGKQQMADDLGVTVAVAGHVRSMLIRAGFAMKLSDALPLGPISDMDMAFRFFPLVQPRDLNGCLLWDGSATGSGYGKFALNGRDVQAHRVAWEYRHGPIPEGMEIDHSFAKGCRSKLCVNHQHLEVVTRAENAQRALAARRWMASIWVRTELDDDVSDSGA